MEFFLSDVEGVNSSIIDNVMDNNGGMDLFEWQERPKKARNKDYYEVVVPQYSDDLFKEHFRMSRGTCDISYIEMYEKLCVTYLHTYVCITF